MRPVFKPRLVDHRFIVGNPLLEIENAFPFDPRAARRWIAAGMQRGFAFSRDITHSLYIDTPDIDILRDGNTMRLRRGGQRKLIGGDQDGALGQIFPNQFAVKRRNTGFQTAANEIASRCYPQAAALGVYPYIRDEIEGEHEYPAVGTSVGFADLPTERWRGSPQSITELVASQIAVGKVTGVRDPADLVLQPHFTTTVGRHTIEFYFEPGQRFDFITAWPYNRPTPDMLRHGHYVAIEVAVDHCAQRRPHNGMPIASIVQASTATLSRCESLGTVGIFEYELDHKRTGIKISDNDAVAGYIQFGLAFRDYVKRRHGLDLMPLRSKATNGYGSLPECRPGGRLHDVYRQALTVAP